MCWSAEHETPVPLHTVPLSPSVTRLVIYYIVLAAGLALCLELW